jgi:hypothetical protein
LARLDSWSADLYAGRINTTERRDMNEQDWQNCTDPHPMLSFLQGSVSDRKLRLFAVACCRRIWEQMMDVRSRQAVELAERSADEPVSDEELDAVSAEAEEAYEDSLTDDQGVAVGADDPRPDAAAAASYASSPGRLGPEHFAVVLEGASLASPVGASQEKAAQVAILRDLFGNPFRPQTPIDAGLLAMTDGTVTKLAEAAYEERSLPSGELANARLAVLADALEEAGCDNADLISHLRSPGPHVRGCFAIDRLLGKE